VRATLGWSWCFEVEWGFVLALGGVVFFGWWRWGWAFAGRFVRGVGVVCADEGISLFLVVGFWADSGGVGFRVTHMGL